MQRSSSLHSMLKCTWYDVVKAASSFLSSSSSNSSQEKLWERELPFISLVWSSIHMEIGAAPSRIAASPQMFFFQVVPVTPPRFRPLGDNQQEHPQTVHYTKILQLNAAVATMSAKKDEAEEPEKVLALMLNSWLELQVRGGVDRL